MSIQQEQFQQQQEAAKKAARNTLYRKLLSSGIGVALAPFTGGASLGLPGMKFSNPFSTASSVSGGSRPVDLSSMGINFGSSSLYNVQH